MSISLIGLVVAAEIAEVAALWKLALVAAIVFLGWIYRDALRTLIQTGSVRLRRGQTELEMRPGAKTPSPDLLGGAEEEPPQQSDLPKETAEDIDPDLPEPKAGDARSTNVSDPPSMGRVTDYVIRGDLKEARTMFQLVQDASEADEKLRNAVHYAYARAQFAGEDAAVQELEELGTNDSVASLARRLHGLIHDAAGNYEQAVKSFEAAIASAPDADARLVAVGALADALFSSGREDEAIARLASELPELRSHESARIYKALSDLYGKREDYLSQALALEKVLEVYPTSAKYHFDAGYAYAQSGAEDLALLHYKAVIWIKPEHEAALNNLGVSYERLNMRIKSVGSYQRSFTQGNTLAAANLANRYIHGGFADEARALLRKAAETERPHGNVAQNMASLTEAQETEGRREEEIQTTTTRKHGFLQRYAEAALVPGETPNLSGDWLLDGQAAVRVTQSGGSFEATYEDAGTPTVLRGSLRNRALTFERSTERETFGGIKRLQRDGDGRGVAEGDSIGLLFEIGPVQDEFHTLTPQVSDPPGTQQS